MVQQPVNKYLDLIKNREALVGTQLPVIIAAVVLGQIDKVFNFTQQDELTSTLVVYVVANVVALLWARAQVWSKDSHLNEVADAYDEGREDGKA